MASSGPPSHSFDSISSNQLPTTPGLGASLGAPLPTEDDSTRLMRITLQLEARNLPNLDTHGRSDPFTVLYRNVDKKDADADSTLDEWERLGQTETVYNNLNPKWATMFQLDYRFGANTVLRFAVYDRDSAADDLNTQDYIGEVRCTVAQVVLAENQRLACPIENIAARTRTGRSAGVLTIRGEESKGDLGETVTFVFGVRNLRRARRPFYVLSRKNRNDGEFAPVIYSEVHQNYSSRSGQFTMFRPITKSVNRLVNNDQDRELMIEFFDYDRRGQHYRGGNVTFTLKSVRAAQASASGLKSFDLMKVRGNGTTINAGELQVRKCEVSSPFSFLDYLRAGTVINTVIAIDMSNTNGNPRDSRSLHYHNPQMPNDYVIALQEVGHVLHAYTTTKTYRTFGFGAVTRPMGTEISHCFPLTGDFNNPVSHGIEGVVKDYYDTLARVAPFGPCRYGPVLDHVIRIAREESERDGRTVYTILLLLTDGDFEDFADVANLICGAADLPLSIVIVGVGNSDFIQLERLDGDTERLCSTDGTPCARDIVQFVKFHDHRYNPTQLSQEVLDEIPDQLMSYMRSRSIKPSDIVPPQAPVSRDSHNGPFYPDPIHSTPLPSNSLLPHGTPSTLSLPMPGHSVPTTLAATPPPPPPPPQSLPSSSIPHPHAMFPPGANMTSSSSNLMLQPPYAPYGPPQPGRTLGHMNSYVGSRPMQQPVPANTTGAYNGPPMQPNMMTSSMQMYSQQLHLGAVGPTGPPGQSSGHLDLQNYVQPPQGGIPPGVSASSSMFWTYGGQARREV